MRRRSSGGLTVSIRSEFTAMPSWIWQGMQPLHPKRCTGYAFQPVCFRHLVYRHSSDVTYSKKKIGQAFLFNGTATTEFYTLYLHDAPISAVPPAVRPL